MRVAFHTPLICVRGSSVALYDYAHYNETLLGNSSVILIPKENLGKSDPLGLIRYASRFRVIPYTNLEETLEEENCDLLYCIKYGKNDGILSKKVKTAVHCVFDMSEIHGDVYTGVSETLARKFGHSLFVPHMVSLTPDNTSNLRRTLNIPENAVVFGRYGGMDTFDLIFCQDVIKELLTKTTDRYFLFINTPRFVEDPRVFYLDKITEEKEKNRFISTCDAHIECGSMGHTFGLAIAEFSVHGKPIIVYDSPALWNTAHLQILGQDAIRFSNREEFYTVLSNFSPYKARNCYSDYAPEKVMNIFKKVFLEK